MRAFAGLRLSMMVLSVLVTGWGRTWAGINVWTSHGPEGGWIRVLVVDPQNSSTVYAGTYGGGVFKSTDGGQSWSAASSGLKGSLVNALVIDPQNPRALYAGLEDGGVFKSTDAGRTWSAANFGLMSSGVTGVTALVVDPRDWSTVYAGGYGIGVFKSTDGGMSWSAASSGSRFSVLDLVNALAIDPQDSRTIYAGVGNVYDSVEPGGVFKSTDGAATWTPVNFGLENVAEVNEVAIDPQNPSTIYAGARYGGLFKSTDGGMSWKLCFQRFAALAIDPQNPNTLYVGAYGGVFKSTDGGTSWNAATSGSTPTGFSALAVDPQNSSTLYAGNNVGVFRSNDGATTWTEVNSGLHASNVLDLAVDPQRPGTLYVGTATGVFKSIDGGISWSAANSGLPNHPVYALAIDRQNPNTLYAGTCCVGRVFKSTDGGISWSAGNNFSLSSFGVREVAVSALAIDPQNPETIYLGSAGRGVFKSTDGGTSWTSASSGLTGSFVNALAIDPQNPRALYAGTQDGVFKSTDGGISWTAATSGLRVTPVYALAIDSQNLSPWDYSGYTVYAGTGLGIFKSLDEGKSWSAANQGLPEGTSVRALGIDPRNPSTLYAGTWHGEGGVFKSTDGGRSWEPVPVFGLYAAYVSRLAVDPQNSSRVYAGTVGGGVFEITFATQTVTGTSFDPGTVQPGGIFTATFSGENLTPETWFDVRFRMPGSTTDQVVLNWQQGPSAKQTVPAATPAGTYTVTGIRAHTDPDDQTGSFNSISATLTVTGAQTFGDWSAPINVGPPINTIYNDNYAVLSRDELTIYFTSDRPRPDGSFGGDDLWFATRESVDSPWREPQNMGALINSPYTDSLPFLSSNQHVLYLYSTRPAGSCGAPGPGDIWMTRRRNKQSDWEVPTNLGCVLNTPADEIAPAFFEDPETEQAWLFYGSNRPGSADYDVYASQLGEDGLAGPGILVPEFSSPGRDTRIFIRKDGLEAFITSNRTGGQGLIDIWTSTRETLSDAWSVPINLGIPVDSSSNDGSPWLSKHGTTLYFFSDRPGGFGKRDIWYTTRIKLND